MKATPSTQFLLTVVFGQLFLFALGTEILQFHRLVEGWGLAWMVLLSLFNYSLGVLLVWRLLKADAERELIVEQGISLKNIEGILQVIRAQRHDLVNHLQTIYALLQMKQERVAREYARKLVNLNGSINVAIDSQRPALAAFLRAKSVEATAADIDLRFELSEQLDELPLNDQSLVIILGNLLDNAFEALPDLPKDKRQVRCFIFREGGQYRLGVTDIGPSVPLAVRERMLTPGFSTKGPGRGAGLSLVKELVEKVGGRIEIGFDPTTVTVIVPATIGFSPGQDNCR